MTFEAAFDRHEVGPSVTLVCGHKDFTRFCDACVAAYTHGDYKTASEPFGSSGVLVEYDSGDTVQFKDGRAGIGSGSVGIITNKITIGGRPCYTVTFPDESSAYAFGEELELV